MRYGVKIMAFLAFFCLSLPFQAQGAQDAYIQDPEGLCFDQEEKDRLNARAQAIYDQYGCELYVWIQSQEPENMTDQSRDLYGQLAQGPDGLLLLAAGVETEIFRGGQLAQEITDLEAQELLDAYIMTDTYYDGVWAYFDQVQEELETIRQERQVEEARAQARMEREARIQEAMTASRTEDGRPRRIQDQAQILSQDQETELEEMLDVIYEEEPCEVAVAAVKSLEGQSPRTFADDYFDSNGFGKGQEQSGILLLLALDSRDWWITTTGAAQRIFTESVLEDMEAEFLPLISQGDYAGGFRQFASLCSQTMDRYQRTPAGAQALGVRLTLGQRIAYSFGQLFQWQNLLIGVFFGGIAAVCGMIFLRSQLKSVQPQTRADNYMKPGSLDITGRQDLFLYRNVTRTPRPKNNGPSSGRPGGFSGGGHRSYSGRSHGGTGGKF